MAWLVHFSRQYTYLRLLLQGYNVRGTVRSTSNKEKTAPLVGLGEALPGSLKLYEADLLKDGSFDEAVKGVNYVIHTASPFLQANEKTDPYVRSFPCLKQRLPTAVGQCLIGVEMIHLTSLWAKLIKLLVLFFSVCLLA